MAVYMRKPLDHKCVSASRRETIDRRPATAPGTLSVTRYAVRKLLVSVLRRKRQTGTRELEPTAECIPGRALAAAAGAIHVVRLSHGPFFGVFFFLFLSLSLSLVFCDKKYRASAWICRLALIRSRLFLPASLCFWSMRPWRGNKTASNNRAWFSSFMPHGPSLITKAKRLQIMPGVTSETSAPSLGV